MPSQISHLHFNLAPKQPPIDSYFHEWFSTHINEDEKLCLTFMGPQVDFFIHIDEEEK
jgi:hypothetical protein